MAGYFCADIVIDSDNVRADAVLEFEKWETLCPAAILVFRCDLSLAFSSQCLLVRICRAAAVLLLRRGRDLALARVQPSLTWSRSQQASRSHSTSSSLTMAAAGFL